jgi:hypothetical protein
LEIGEFLNREETKLRSERERGKKADGGRRKVVSDVRMVFTFVNIIEQMV